MNRRSKVKKSSHWKSGYALMNAVILILFLANVSKADHLEEKGATRSSGISSNWTGLRSSNYLDLGLGYLFSRSSCSCQISFPDRAGRGKSSLDFNGPVSAIPILFLDLQHPDSTLVVSLQFGKGGTGGGQGMDSDYTGGSLYHRSEFDVTIDTLFLIAEIQTAFSSSSQPRWVLKPFLGWQHYEEKIRMSKGRWTILSGEKSDRPLEGLDSRYVFNWDALRMGIKGEVDLLTLPPLTKPLLKLKSTLAVFPFIHYRGNGTWNLREDLHQDPSFIHEADNLGLLGLDWTLSLAYRPLKWLEFEGGGRLFYFSVQDGSNNTLFSNNTSAIVTLDEAKALRMGFFFQIIGRF